MKRIATLAAGVALVVPATAQADSSATCQAYNPQFCNNTHLHRSSTSAGTLPFTGLDVALLAIGGGTLLGGGFVVRRVSRRVGEDSQTER